MISMRHKLKRTGLYGLVVFIGSALLLQLGVWLGIYYLKLELVLISAGWFTALNMLYYWIILDFMIVWDDEQCEDLYLSWCKEFKTIEQFKKDHKIGTDKEFWSIMKKGQEINHKRYGNL